MDAPAGIASAERLEAGEHRASDEHDPDGGPVAPGGREMRLEVADGLAVLAKGESLVRIQGGGTSGDDAVKGRFLMRGGRPARWRWPGISVYPRRPSRNCRAAS